VNPNFLIRDQLFW